MSEKPIHMTGKEYYEALRQARKEALEEAAKLVCPWCRDGSWSITSYNDGFGKVHEHLKIGEKYTPRCAASPILDFIAADKDQPTQAEPVEMNEGEPGTLEHLNWLDAKIAKAVENIATEED